MNEFKETNRGTLVHIRHLSELYSPVSRHELANCTRWTNPCHHCCSTRNPHYPTTTNSSSFHSHHRHFPTNHSSYYCYYCCCSWIAWEQALPWHTSAWTSRWRVRLVNERLVGLAWRWVSRNRVDWSQRNGLCQRPSWELWCHAESPRDRVRSASPRRCTWIRGSRAHLHIERRSQTGTFLSFVWLCRGSPLFCCQQCSDLRSRGVLRLFF